MRVAHWLIAVSSALVWPVACFDPARECVPLDELACTCANGDAGVAECAQDGSGYSACDCSSQATGGAGGGGGDGGGGDGGDGGEPLLPYLDACEEDEQCETGLCFPFNAKGPHCSKTCETADDCPPPSTGCSGMGVCKVP